MIDLADLVVIAGRVLGTGPEPALAQLDIAAAHTALAAARPASTADAQSAATTAAQLMQALLRHRPFPTHHEQIAVAAGLQFLALNGWRADLDPPGPALMVIEGLASGQVSPADAAAWLRPRLAPQSAPANPDPPALGAPMPTLRSRTARLLRNSLTTANPVRQAGIFTSVTGFLPFTADAREAVLAAHQEADRLGLDYPGSGQFLLAMSTAGQGAAAEALKRLGIGPEAVRAELTQLSRPDPPPAPDLPPHPMRVMPRAVAEAVSSGHDYIGTEHMVLAFFHTADTTAAQALARLGVGEKDIRAEVTPSLPTLSPTRAGHRRGRRPPTREEELRRLRLENARLTELLRHHGIEPGEPGRRSA